MTLLQTKQKWILVWFISGLDVAAMMVLLRCRTDETVREEKYGGCPQNNLLDLWTLDAFVVFS